MNDTLSSIAGTPFTVSPLGMAFVYGRSQLTVRQHRPIAKATVSRSHCSRPEWVPTQTEGMYSMSLQPFQDVKGLLQQTPLPPMILLRQRFPRQRVEDVGQEVARVLGGSNLGVGAPFIAPKSARIGIGVGSRGVAEIAGVVRALVAWLRGQGAEPFIFPALGSHGGATPEGQRSVLESLGVTEDFVGAPIIASMEVDLLGHL